MKLYKVSSFVFQFGLILFVSYSSYGQVGIGTTSPEESAIVELKSENKGLLLPRMTSSQRDLISGPENGIIIYNTTDKCLNVYNGSVWEELGCDN